MLIYIYFCIHIYIYTYTSSCINIHICIYKPDQAGLLGVILIHLNGTKARLTSNSFAQHSMFCKALPRTIWSLPPTYIQPYCLLLPNYVARCHFMHMYLCCLLYCLKMNIIVYVHTTVFYVRSMLCH